MKGRRQRDRSEAAWRTRMKPTTVLAAIIVLVLRLPRDLGMATSVVLAAGGAEVVALGIDMARKRDSRNETSSQNVAVNKW